MSLDLDRPYEEVIGVAGVKFMQGANFFAVDGHPMLMEMGKARRLRADEMAALEPVKAPSVPTTDAAVNYDTMSTAELKATLAVYGETWVNRVDAIAFLRDHG